MIENTAHAGAAMNSLKRNAAREVAQTRAGAAGRASCLVVAAVATVAAACDLPVAPIQPEPPETTLVQAPPVPAAASDKAAPAYALVDLVFSLPLGSSEDVLVYVDGVRQDETGGLPGFDPKDVVRTLAGLDPRDIDRIEVLKAPATETLDAAAGAGRAGGVIKISVKPAERLASGQAGEGARIRIRGSHPGAR